MMANRQGGRHVRSPCGTKKTVDVAIQLRPWSCPRCEGAARTSIRILYPSGHQQVRLLLLILAQVSAPNALTKWLDAEPRMGYYRTGRCIMSRSKIAITLDGGAH